MNKAFLENNSVLKINYKKENWKIHKYVEIK